MSVHNPHTSQCQQSATAGTANIIAKGQRVRGIWQMRTPRTGFPSRIQACYMQCPNMEPASAAGQCHVTRTATYIRERSPPPSRVSYRIGAVRKWAIRQHTTHPPPHSCQAAGLRAGPWYSAPMASQGAAWSAKRRRMAAPGLYYWLVLVGPDTVTTKCVTDACSVPLESDSQHSSWLIHRQLTVSVPAGAARDRQHRTALPGTWWVAICVRVGAAAGVWVGGWGPIMAAEPVSRLGAPPAVCPCSQDQEAARPKKDAPAAEAEGPRVPCAQGRVLRGAWAFEGGGREGGGPAVADAPLRTHASAHARAKAAPHQPRPVLLSFASHPRPPAAAAHQTPCVPRLSSPPQPCMQLHAKAR